MKEEQQLNELMALGQKAGRFSCHPMHAWANFRGRLLRIVISPAFSLFNAFVIFINAIVLGLNW